MDITILNKTSTLNQGITTIGSSNEADIPVEAPSLSSIHARFILTGATLEVEDLGSEKGTSVNGRPVRGRYGLIRGDRLLFAEVPCGVSFPNEGVPAPAASPAPAPASRPRIRISPELQAKGYKRQEAVLIRRIVGLAIGIIVAACMYSFIVNYVPADLARAREELDAAEIAIAACAEGRAGAGYAELSTELEALKARLGPLAASFPSEKKRAVALIDRIDSLLVKIETERTAWQREEEARGQLTAIEAALADGSLATAAAIERLKALSGACSGTAAADTAAERAHILDRQLTASEKELVARTRKEALIHAENHRFTEAFSVIDRCLGRTFLRLEAADLEPLKGTRDLVNIKAAAWFQEAVDRALEQAATGDREQLKQELRERRAAAGPADLDAILTGALKKLGQ